MLQGTGGRQNAKAISYLPTPVPDSSSTGGQDVDLQGFAAVI